MPVSWVCNSTNVTKDQKTFRRAYRPRGSRAPAGRLMLTYHRASLQEHPPRELYGLVTLPFMLIAHVTERDPGTDTKAHIWLFFRGRSKLNRREHVRILEESNSGQHSVHLPQQPGTSLWLCYCCWQVNCRYCHTADSRIIVTVALFTVELLLLKSHCWQ